MSKTYNSLRTYFQDKIKSKEPSLFLTSKTPGKNTAEVYSRNCQSSQKRQPVILSSNEYQQIVSKYPEYSSPDKHIIYGTGDTKYYYICPKYWDVRNNTPISDEDMEKGDLYKHVISDSQKKITEDKYIYHLSDNGKVNPYPNFIIKNGQCAPCCFQKNTTAKKKLREQCNQSIEPSQAVSNKGTTTKGTTNDEEELEVVPKKSLLKSKQTRKNLGSSEPEQPVAPVVKVSPPVKDTKVISKQTSEYVKNADKFPMDPGRLGMLPIGLQNLFEPDISTCKFIYNNKVLKTEYDCILRSGIRLNPNQSFLECISDMYDITIDRLKFKIHAYLTIDRYVSMYNGNLVNAFYDPNLDTTAFHDLYTQCTSTSELYSLLTMDDTYNETVLMYNYIYFDKIFVSYVNFIHNYLFKTNIMIDHTYMWDIILQIYDVNLCIFEITSNSTRGDTVDLLCPPNRYSRAVLNPGMSFDIGVIIKKNNYFEPVYIMRTCKKQSKQIKFFNEKQTSVAYTVNTLKKLIWGISTKCAIINKYLSIYELIRAVNSKNYTITHKIMDYSTKIIGLRIHDTSFDIYGVVPCIPGTIIESDFYITTIPTKMVTGENVWSSFEDTIRFFGILFEDFDHDPVASQLQRLVYVLLDNDKQIEGFITSNMQLIPITDRPVYTTKMHSRYKPYPGKFMTYEEEQKVSLLNVTPIEEDLDLPVFSNIRQQISNDLNMENTQFILFRNLIKILLTRSDTVKQLIDRVVMEYPNQMAKGTFNTQKKEELIYKLVQLLEELTTQDESGTDVVFINDAPPNFMEKLLSMDITTAKTVELFDMDNNRTNYYIKIAEELLFNPRMRQYLLDDTINISLYKKTYDINPTEILVGDISINDYYDNINYSPIPKQHVNDYYDMGVLYSETHPLSDASIITNEFVQTICDEPTTIKINSTNYIKRGVVSNIVNTISQQSFACVYSIVDVMLKTIYPDAPRKTFGDIRTDLVNTYMQYARNEKYVLAIYDILINEGKQTNIQYLTSLNELTISNLINLPTYTLTILDYWMLCITYNIPAVIIRDKIPSNKQKNTEPRAIWICNREKYTTLPTTFFCIMIFGNTSGKQTTYIYTLVVKNTTTEGRLFSINDFLGTSQATLRDAFINGLSIDDYIQKEIPKTITIFGKN